MSLPARERIGCSGQGAVADATLSQMDPDRARHIEGTMRVALAVAPSFDR